MDIVFETRGIALDIDDTLSATNDYWAAELQRQFPHPTLTTEEIKIAYKWLEEVPHWQTPEAQAWMERARTEDYLQEVLPILEDAHKMVEEVRAIVPVVGYFTARPTKVREATERWLAKYRFPDAPVITRPEHVTMEESSKWKADMLHAHYPNVLGIIDDNPGLVEKLPAGYEGTVFLYRQTEHPRTDIRVFACRDWQDVVEKARGLVY